MREGLRKKKTTSGSGIGTLSATCCPMLAPQWNFVYVDKADAERTFRDMRGALELHGSRKQNVRIEPRMWKRSHVQAVMAKHLENGHK
ncbi:hypothetical protein R1flu_012453 [Riccia fluitans]|uniref:Uncharacterized protein n=1 Tax=Riccia fluitans TaxID=41844 RepID=A0ABD1ZAZ6_9MARC